MAKTINLSFDGYWLKAIGDDAKGSGIYLVYRGVDKDKSVSLKELIYIGESETVQARIEKHEKNDKWKAKLQTGEILIFSFASVTSPDRERAEAALIFKHKPDCNDEYVNNFPFDQTTVNSKGKCKFILPSFTVNKT